MLLAALSMAVGTVMIGLFATLTRLQRRMAHDSVDCVISLCAGVESQQWVNLTI